MNNRKNRPKETEGSNEHPKNNFFLNLVRISGILLILIFSIFCLLKQDFLNIGSQDDIDAETSSNAVSTEPIPLITPIIEDNTGTSKTEESIQEETEEDLKQREETKILDEKIKLQLEEADNFVLNYDYEGAMECIKAFDGNYEEHVELTDAMAKIEEIISTLRPFGAYDSVNEISHIFFHSLIADTSKAFDGDTKQKGYNYYMTTVGEFNKIMEQMYEDGYVLVSIHDIIKKITKEDGTFCYEPGDLQLPPDKKPFILSQDDVNYYDYMSGDGFATRMVVDEQGRPSTEMILEDGTVTLGDYDMVPALETFLETHPDFSYHGARGIIALTGYEGTLGYRTNLKSSETYEEDLIQVKEVIDVMKQWGWEFASHSYGHRDMGQATDTFTITDTDRWMEEVGTLVGPTDIYIFPYGTEIDSTYSGYSNNKFKYLHELGFDYYCGVYKEPWMQIHSDYVRMSRRPLDGQAMLQNPDCLKDLFLVSEVVDTSRPALQ